MGRHKKVVEETIFIDQAPKKYKLDENTRALGDLVIIQNVVQDVTRYTHDGIYIPNQYMENNKAVKGKVLSLGPKAAEEGLQVGDIVLYDKHSIFAQEGATVGTEKENKIVITRVENVIGIVEE
jgi:co-chaperonin GroES (HSP10)